MFSKACTYAIRAMVYIESFSEVNRNINLVEITEAIDSPVAFTAKILQKLKKSGLLVSAIGAKGGFQIPKNKKVTIRDIVSAIDGDDVFTKCVLGLKVCSSVNTCPAHEKYKVLADYMLKDLLGLHLKDISKGVINKTLMLK